MESETVVAEGVRETIGELHVGCVPLVRLRKACESCGDQQTL